MHTVNYWLLALAIACVSLWLLGCAGRGIESAGRDARPTDSPPHFSLVPLPSSLPTPEGVEPEIWQLLTTEFEKQLLQLRGVSMLDGKLEFRTVSTPPTNQRSQTVLSTFGPQLKWGYYSNGDYHQNREVNVADITPLALHFQETAPPGGFPANSVQAVVDGDGNGEINLADITPIVLNFQNYVGEYRVYQSQDTADYPTAHDADNGAAELVSTLNFSLATGDPNAARLQFFWLMPEPLNNDYFWVRPADNGGTEGIASNLSGPFTTTFTLDGHVYMAGGGIDPLPGVPVELSQGTTLIASTVTDINGHYSFEGLVNGEYVVTPTGDPYGYSPESRTATISSADKYLPPIYPAPVDIVRRWALDIWATMGGDGGAMAMDADGNVFLAGEFGSGDAARTYLLKYDLFANLVWSKVYHLPYSGGGVQITLLPNGEIYLYGSYNLDDSLDVNLMDLYFLKLDSSGGILWDFAFNYPTSDLQDHRDNLPRGYVDSQSNLIVYTKSHYGPEQPGYMLKISPEGEILEQVHYEPSSATYDEAVIYGRVIDPMGYLLGSGGLLNESSTKSVLVRFTPAGTIEWINSWGGLRTSSGTPQAGLDGYIYLSFQGHPPGNPDERGIQLARYDYNGVREWEILCSTEYQMDGWPTPETRPPGQALGSRLRANPCGSNTNSLSVSLAVQPGW